MVWGAKRRFRTPALGCKEDLLTVGYLNSLHVLVIVGVSSSVVGYITPHSIKFAQRFKKVWTGLGCAHGLSFKELRSKKYLSGGFPEGSGAIAKMTCYFS